MRHVRLNVELLEEVDCFKYLWSQVAADGGCERRKGMGYTCRMHEGYREWGALKSVLNTLANTCEDTCKEVSIYEGVIVPTALYGAEAWGMRGAERREVKVLEMKCLRSLVGVLQWIQLAMRRCLEELVWKES